MTLAQDSADGRWPARRPESRLAQGSADRSPGGGVAGAGRKDQRMSTVADRTVGTAPIGPRPSGTVVEPRQSDVGPRASGPRASDASVAGRSGSCLPDSHQAPHRRVAADHDGAGDAAGQPGLAIARADPAGTGRRIVGGRCGERHQLLHRPRYRRGDAAHLSSTAADPRRGTQVRAHLRTHPRGGVDRADGGLHELVGHCADAVGDRVLRPRLHQVAQADHLAEHRSGAGSAGHCRCSSAGPR